MPGPLDRLSELQGRALLLRGNRIRSLLIVIVIRRRSRVNTAVFRHFLKAGSAADGSRTRVLVFSRDLLYPF